MSDYLWDKTGEADEDVEQLENLLGALKYQPRPLEIPASAMPTVRATRPAMFFSRPRLAIAASLLLTLLAGTWFVTRQTEQRKDQLATADKGSKTVKNKQAETATVTQDKSGDDAPVENAKSKNVDEPERRRQMASLVKPFPFVQQLRTPRQVVHRRHKLQPRRSVENAPAPRELVATNGGMRWEVEQPLTPQQREATEKLMLALQVASAKFNYAQREMQEIGRAGK